MPRIMITCPSGYGAVATGYRTADVDLTTRTDVVRSFRCACGGVHSWNEDAAWAEAGLCAAARRSYGLEADPAEARAGPGR